MDIRCISLVLAGLCFSTIASAIPKEMDKDGPICSSVLCAFKEKGGFYAGVSGYYVQPVETGIGLVTDSWLFVSPGGFTAESKPVDTKYKWAGAVKIGYDFPMSANNIEVNYLHLGNNTHAVNSFANGAIGFGSVLFPDVVIPLASFPELVSDAHLRYTLNQVDVKVGRKYRDVSGVFSIRPSLGLRYVELEHNLSFAAPGNAVSEFNGVGPMLGVDANYQLGRGFGLVGYFDYGLLMGHINSHSFLNLGGPNFNFSWPDRGRLVNNFTGRLGIDYNYVCSNSSTIGIEIGYQASEYLNATDTLRGYIFTGGVQHIAGNETNNFSFSGPYASLTIHL